ncbi:hypothetical protein [Sulfuracidifex metallicus]|uniref:Uncharacterized protein n=1 Tax=Sulfuracidifex metallicus DSM 6482 = JCM 9184 TaxID=523847 RepID=A0A6A9QMR5_SULME|nr:hypothetical protein [Sulfuracidifex metallicus]MUN29439.1 hypothetical protein [Sulfuracidifex metallicus DSM 6482 = JCM 9184]WOE50050.1 hypothetical protein RQ359_001550 [Sulfuracidifex metallicus DSM 6482 = JCM 9184]
MREIKLDKLINFLKGNSSYSYSIEEDKLMISFQSPTLEEAGGDGDLSKVYLITFRIKGETAILESCKLIDGLNEREIQGEIDFWLDYIEISTER